MRIRLSLFFLFFIIFIGMSYKSIYASQIVSDTAPTAQPAPVISTRTISSISDGMPINANLPQVSSSDAASAFADTVNDTVTALYRAKEKTAKSLSAKKLLITHTTEIDGSITSIIINTDTTISTASVRRDVDTINVDLSAEKVIGINDALGVNGVSIANKVINAAIAADPQKYNQPFFGITNTQDFYVRDNKVYIVFDSFEITSGKEGPQTFEIDKDQIKTIVLSKNSYAEKESYNLKMIPLRTVCEYFGYEVRWSSYPPSADVRRRDGKNYSVFANYPIIVNENRYYKSGGARRMLESAPELITFQGSSSAVCCVPLSYFSEILSLFYYVDASGTITFSEYN